jgi:recombination protein RecT
MASAQDRIDKALEKRNTASSQLHDDLTSKAALAFLKGVAPGLDPRALALVAYAQVKATPALMACEPRSIVRAVAEAAKLKLNVDGVLGHAYLVPFKDRGVPKAQMMLGYRGMLHLAYQSDKVERVHAAVIHEADLFAYHEGTVPHFHHERPKLGTDRGPMIGAYAMAHLRGSTIPLIEVLDQGEIEARRQSSASFRFKPKDSPWTTHADAMWMKTAVRALGKRLPVPELQAAALRDEARDEGRAVAPSVIDLGDADLVPDGEPTKPEQSAPAATNQVAKEEARELHELNHEAGACIRCGRLDLRKDHSCPDCDSTKGGA